MSLVDTAESWLAAHHEDLVEWRRHIHRYPELGHALLVCATETKLQADIDSYAGALTDVMNPSRVAA